MTHLGGGGDNPGEVVDWRLPDFAGSRFYLIRHDEVATLAALLQNGCKSTAKIRSPLTKQTDHDQILDAAEETDGARQVVEPGDEAVKKQHQCKRAEQGNTYLGQTGMKACQTLVANERRAVHNNPDSVRPLSRNGDATAFVTLAAHM
jgi:hypothetical protein